MSDKIININEAVELYLQELDAISGGKDVPVSPSYDSADDLKLMARSHTDLAIQSVNEITTALHLIALNI
ncbi:MAG: hypothetical protein KME23_18735 [Goleter apudmare HA4340-LM2]|jgi:hypothetical protein|nr:hypothetical protein [Goleter apudmare HA4340-LM2]